MEQQGLSSPGSDGPGNDAWRRALREKARLNQALARQGGWANAG